jgi:hypothetical protein
MTRFADELVEMTWHGAAVMNDDDDEGRHDE